jgi:glycosyltransferase involved in cell wall biosynthesis
LSHPRLVSVHRKRIDIVRREVDRIIVPTLTTSNDLIKLGFDPEKIRIIPEAPDSIYQHQRRDKVIEVRRKYRINGNYLLAVGATPRKNVERIIRAFEKVGGEIKVKLVIIGQKYGNIAENRGTMFLGHIPEKDMPSLYSGAEALVYPSLYEGFGLPILEAFASGIPVVTSNFGSMKEVASDAARLVDPYNISSVKDGIIDVIKNRKVYIDKGKARIKDFSWRKTALSTLETYKEAYQ